MNFEDKKNNSKVLIPRTSNKIFNIPILIKNSINIDKLIKINIKKLIGNKQIDNYFNSMDDLYQLRHNRIFKRDIILNPILNYDSNDIQIATYNILVPYMIYTTKYEHIKKEPSIMWFYRWEMIKREINYYNPDIICLQEVQNDLFYRDILPYFQSIKYMGHFITMEPILIENRFTEKFNSSNVLGIATFYRIDKFRLDRIHTFEYINIATKLNPDIPIQRLNHRYGNLILQLENIITNKQFLISNIHIISKSTLEDIKTYMIYLTLQNANKLTNKHNIPYILCGDFNSVPNSCIYKGITTGINDNIFESDIKNITDKIIKPILESPTVYTKYPLTSCYASICGKEPSYTNYTEKFKETLDYIFINKQCKIIGILDELILTDIKSIPDEYNPSDHILQMAIIRLL
jgi:CCR4-NOT transcription complex subunit 6